MVTEAYKVLLKLYPADEVPKVIDNLKSIVRPNETTGPTVVNIWRTAVRTKQFRKCLYLGVVVQLASQAAGLILISYERPILSRSAGVSKMAESTATLILQLIGEIVNLILQDGIAIRRLILITIFILSLDLLGIGFILYCIYQDYSSSGSLLSVAVLLIGVYYIVYPVGLGTAPWLVNASVYNVWYAILKSELIFYYFILFFRERERERERERKGVQPTCCSGKSLVVKKSENLRVRERAEEFNFFG